MQEIIESLSPHERLILPLLNTTHTITQLAEQTHLPEIAILRAAQFLSNKELAKITTTEEITYKKTERGEEIIKNGFPEERLYNQIKKTPTPLNKLREEFGEETNISIGALKKQHAIEIQEGIVHTTKNTPTFLTEELKNNIEHKELIKRGLIEPQKKIIHTITLTQHGKTLATTDLGEAPEETLTAEDLQSREYKNKTYRRYDVTTRVPSITPGRTHFVQEAIDRIKQHWIEMGFEEMNGTVTQTAYWDLDVLFVPQNHPAREMQDTFYLPHKGLLPSNWEETKEIHENGGKTGSSGWKTPYSKEEAQKVLLRTHTTALSAQHIAQLKKEDLPKKYFSVAKVYRNETLDWKHLAEFHQVEGIVIGEDLTLQDLIGLQKKFYAKMGYTDIRVRPAYFPYTEPSCEVDVYDPVKQQWKELGGMGIFRPEVVIPLFGEDITVLAWGLGMERIITAYYEITDLREIYSNKLDDIKNKKRYNR